MRVGALTRAPFPARRRLSAAALARTRRRCTRVHPTLNPKPHPRLLVELDDGAPPRVQLQALPAHGLDLALRGRKPYAPRVQRPQHLRLHLQRLRAYPPRRSACTGPGPPALQVRVAARVHPLALARNKRCCRARVRSPRSKGLLDHCLRLEGALQALATALTSRLGDVRVHKGRRAPCFMRMSCRKQERGRHSSARPSKHAPPVTGAVQGAGRVEGRARAVSSLTMRSSSALKVSPPSEPACGMVATVAPSCPLLS